ncbi:hypothetical protein LCM20_10600 [Halobacillus litoralis]|uniref:hypothetical protein n=1 Tax=Halobacillus litoralis TaxID=45668 RepID=UPI001CD8068F|nr:hypothetical protein [Halobacillus litoralis]MCA0971040.1 hypothetical protein [Halobacillus litoralis]
MPDSSSQTLLKRSQLLKECSDAYAYAVEVVTKNSVMAEDIAMSCAEVCYECAKECTSSEPGLFDEELYNMCLQYASLCERMTSVPAIERKDAALKESS